MSRTKPPAAIDPRLKERRTEVTRAAGRRRLRILIRTLVVVAVGAGMVGLVFSPALDVDTVKVEGARNTAGAAVTKAAGLDSGRTAMLTLDRMAMAGRVERLPWVARATVERSWPSTVVIRVVERRPVATLPVANGVALVDATGRVLATVTSPPPGLVAIGVPPRPRLAGVTAEPTVQHALRVVTALPARLAEQVAAVAVTGEAADATFDLDLHTGVKVQVGLPTDLAAKFRAALAVLDAEQPPRGSILDVRVARSPTLRGPV